jgi:molybdopterin-binding protein
MMKISARNSFEGTITDIQKGTTTAHVVIDVKGTKVTASITNEAVDELGLTVGKKANAFIKASDVLVAA